jgi:hypothetical protein
MHRTQFAKQSRAKPLLFLFFSFPACSKRQSLFKARVTHLAANDPEGQSRIGPKRMDALPQGAS